MTRGLVQVWAWVQPDVADSIRATATANNVTVSAVVWAILEKRLRDTPRGRRPRHRKQARHVRGMRGVQMHARVPEALRRKLWNYAGQLGLTAGTAAAIILSSEVSDARSLDTPRARA